MPCSAMAAKTAMLIPKNAWVTITEEESPAAQGTGITGWIASSGSSPRFAASWRTHHSQIFRKENAGSLRPHWVQFAIAGRTRRRTGTNSLFRSLHVDGGSVGQNLGDALHDLGGIVAGADDRIAAEFRRMLQHQVEGLGARFLTQVGQQRDVAANYSLEASADCAEN